MDTDVIVVGAGPTGLLLAGDLAAAGVDVTVLEKRPEGLSNLTRAFAVHARTLEVLDARGLADDLLRSGQRVSRVRLLGRVDLDLSGLPTRFPFVLATPQYEVERLLLRRAHEAGVRFRHEAHVTAVRQDGDGVTADVDGASPVRARWLVGTDGVRSTVRDAVGIGFPGHTVVRAMVLGDVRVEHPPADVLAIATRDRAFGFLVPFGDGWHRFIGLQEDHDIGDPVTLDEVRAVARASFGDDVGIREARFLTRFAADERQAPTYRAGRVLLAGDAAHVHSPAGGLGMNTGLQDAANLGWKLAAVLRGADPALVDTYEAERHPVGRDVLRVSGTILRVAIRSGPAAVVGRRLATAVLRRAPLARRRAAATISALGVRYPSPRGAHPAVGARVPDLPLTPGPGGVRLAEALRAGRFVEVLPAAGAVPLPRADGEVDVAERVTVHRADGFGVTLLVRPDGYLAAVG